MQAGRLRYARQSALSDMHTVSSDLLFATGIAVIYGFGGVTKLRQQIAGGALGGLVMLFRDLIRPSALLALSLLMLAAASGSSRVWADDDAVAIPPAVQGNVTGVAVDADGNRYVTGSFSGTRDFNPGVGADIKTAANGEDLFVTRFNADGSYAWTQTLGLQGSAQGRAILVSNGTLYVAGWAYVYDAPPVATPTNDARGVSVVSSFPQCISTALVLALDAATGARVAAFGDNGLRAFSGTNGAEGNALILNENTLYVAGTIQPAPWIYWLPPIVVQPLVPGALSAAGYRRAACAGRSRHRARVRLGRGCRQRRRHGCLWHEGCGDSDCSLRTGHG
jgi:hypothetical protein